MIGKDFSMRSSWAQATMLAMWTARKITIIIVIMRISHMDVLNNDTNLDQNKFVMKHKLAKYLKVSFI